MKPLLKIEENKITGVAKKVIFYDNNLTISFVRFGKGARALSPVLKQNGLTKKEEADIIGRSKRKYYKQAREILHRNRHSKLKKNLLENHNKALHGISHNKQEQIWWDNFIKKEIYLNTDGGIIILQRKKRSKTTKKIPVKFSDLFSSLRAQEYIPEYYIGDDVTRGEIASIKKLGYQIANLNSFIIKANETGAYNNEILLNKSKEIQEELNKCRNHLKKNVKQKIKDAETEKDSLGRKNLGAKACETIAAQNYLKKRLEEISQIIFHISARKDLLNNFRVFNNRRMQEVRTSLEYCDSKNFHRDKESINKALGIALHILSWRLIEPYKGVAEKIKNDIFLLKDALQKENENLFITVLRGNIYFLLTWQEEEQNI